MGMTVERKVVEHYSLGDLAERLFAALDQSGVDDLLVLVFNSLPRLLLADGRGGFSDASGLLPSPTRGAMQTAAAFDVDGDFDLDLVMAPAGPAQPILALNDGFADFRSFRVLPPVVVAHSIVAGNVVGDSGIDVVIVPDSVTLGVPVVLENLGNAQFQPVRDSVGSSSTGSCTWRWRTSITISLPI